MAKRKHFVSINTEIVDGVTCKYCKNIKAKYSSIYKATHYCTLTYKCPRCEEETITFWPTSKIREYEEVNGELK